MNYLWVATEGWAGTWIAGLWRVTWQGAIVLAVAWATVRFCTFLSPRIACWIWRLACLKLLAIFFWAQPVLLPLLPEQQIVTAVAQPTVAHDGTTLPAAAKPIPVESNSVPSSDAFAAGNLLVLFWLLGVTLQVLISLRQWHGVRRLCRSAFPSQSVILEHMCRHEAERLGIGRLPQLRFSRQADGPLLAGVWRPTILLPDGALETFGEAELRLMLSHELAHLRRRDLAWNWLPTVVTWLFFFQPLVWRLSRLWSEAQEAACDELLIQQRVARPSEYGRLLLKLSTCWPQESPAGLATAGVLGSYRNLERRILAMTRVQPFSTRRVALAALALSLVALFGTVPWRLVAQETPRPAVADDAKHLAVARAETMEHMKYIGLGLHNYHNEHHSFPPAAIVDAKGNPLLSWRVAILPYMEPDQKELYKKFHLDEPWDSEHNKALLAEMPAIYRCAASKAADTGRTVYLVPRGESTVFPGLEGISYRKITDGTTCTVGVVEVDENHAVPWTKPEDWTFDPANPARGLGGHFPDVIITMFCDGSSHAISTALDKETLRAIFTRNGKEPVNFSNGTIRVRTYDESQ